MGKALKLGILRKKQAKLVYSKLWVCELFRIVPWIGTVKWFESMRYFRCFPQYKLWPDCRYTIGDWNAKEADGTNAITAWPDCRYTIGDWNEIFI